MEKKMAETASWKAGEGDVRVFDTHPEAVALQPFCVGKGVDVGCGFRKTHPDAIGIDLLGKGEIGQYGCMEGMPSVADIKASGDDLYMFKDGELDYVVNRHNLEHYVDVVKTLWEWKRVLKIGGVLGMVLPDETRLDTIALDPTHKHVFTPESITNLLVLIGGFRVEKVEVVIPDWSFLVVARRVEEKGALGKTLPSGLFGELRSCLPERRGSLHQEDSDSACEGSAVATSTYSHIPTIIRFLKKTRPSSILDVGVGNGKIGFVARDYLDVMLGQRNTRKDWRVRIDGIEIFSDYIQEHQKAVYDSIFIGDALDVIQKLERYDVVILGDVVEHLEKERAMDLLDACASRCGYMILAMPLGRNWKQPAVYGYPSEECCSFWQYEEFKPFVCDEELFSFSGTGDYGCFLVQTEDYLHHRTREKADALFSEGKRDQAVAYMENSIRQLPPNVESEYILVDLLLKSGRIREAVDRLKGILNVFPENRAAKRYLGMLAEKTTVASQPGNQ
ncbi:MAG: methyltransferase domain-containing protein [Deltaproteobacteria bacterium]|nr:methyltransferase domain-containing protein [Deltaproteobacteria bacterium]